MVSRFMRPTERSGPWNERVWVMGRALVLSFIVAGGLSLPSTLLADPFATSNCDVNGDNARDISDATSLLGFLFLGGTRPVEYRPDRVHPSATIQNGDCDGQAGRGGS